MSNTATCPQCGELGELECLGEFHQGFCQHTGDEIVEPYIIFTCGKCGYREEDI